MNNKTELRSLAVAAGGALLITTISMAGFAALLPHQSERTPAIAKIQRMETVQISATRLPKVEQMETILVTASRQIPTDMVATARRARVAS